MDVRVTAAGTLIGIYFYVQGIDACYRSRSHFILTMKIHVATTVNSQSLMPSVHAPTTHSACLLALLLQRAHFGGVVPGPCRG